MNCLAALPCCTTSCSSFNPPSSSKRELGPGLLRYVAFTLCWYLSGCANVRRPCQALEQEKNEFRSTVLALQGSDEDGSEEGLQLTESHGTTVGDKASESLLDHEYEAGEIDDHDDHDESLRLLREAEAMKRAHDITNLAFKSLQHTIAQLMETTGAMSEEEGAVATLSKAFKALEAQSMAFQLPRHPALLAGDINRRKASVAVLSVAECRTELLRWLTVANCLAWKLCQVRQALGNAHTPPSFDFPCFQDDRVFSEKLKSLETQYMSVVSEYEDRARRAARQSAKWKRQMDGLRRAIEDERSEVSLLHGTDTEESH